MTQPAQTPKTTRLRIDPSLDPRLVEWVKERSVPGGPFYSLSHAAEFGVARIQDELDVVRESCKQRKVPFDAAAFWQIHGSELAQSVPNEEGRPTKTTVAAGYVRRTQMFISIDRGLLDWIARHAAPKGPFAAASPVPHAIEYGLRILRTADGQAPRRSASIPLDEATLWARYVDLRKTR